MSTPRITFLGDTAASLGAVAAVAHDTTSDDLRAEWCARHVGQLGATDLHTDSAATDADGTDPATAEFIAQALASDVVVFSLYAGASSAPGWQQLLDARAEQPEAERAILHIHTPTEPASLRDVAAEHSTTGEHFDAINAAMDAGGTTNLRAVFAFLVARSRGEDAELAPHAFPAQGYYHPSTGALAHTPQLAAGPKVGLWFPATLVTGSNLAVIDETINALEQRGLIPVPIYGEKFPDGMDVLETRVDATLRRFFQPDGATIIDALISFHPLSLALRSPELAGIYDELGVPTFQALITSQPPTLWRSNPSGATAREVATLAAQPELDGILTGGVVGGTADDVDEVTGARPGLMAPLRPEIQALADLVQGWATLKHTQASGRKVAIVLHQHTPRLDRVGTATGLDAFESARVLLQRMKDDGYDVGEIPSASQMSAMLTKQLVAGGGWADPAEAVKRAAFTIDAETTRKWHEDLPPTLAQAVTGAWGPAPGEVNTHEGTTYLAAIDFGNVVLTVQPPRGVIETMRSSDTHNSAVPPPHAYLNAYRFWRDEYGVDAIVHLGSHGSIEWLPGQALGLSADSATEVALGGVPNIYPYVVNNPGEVTQAKRRSHGVTISHLPPPVKNAGLHGDLAQINRVVQDYTDAAMDSPQAQMKVAEELWKVVEAAGIDTDFGMDREAALADVHHFVEHVHHYLLDLGDNQVNDGLHVLGVPPTGERLTGYVSNLLRNGDAENPSLRDELFRAKDLDLEELSRDASVIIDGTSAGELIMGVDDLATELVGDVLGGMEPAAALEQRGVPHTRRLERALGRAQALADLVSSCTAELDAVMDALNAKFVSPGPSGVPTRGDLDVLPTGRNMTTLDPRDLPTPAAYAAGVEAANALLTRYLRWGDHADHSEGGSHRGESHSTGVGAEEKREQVAEAIAVVLWGTATMRSRGEDIAQALHLLGVRPVWDEAGHVSGVEPISVSELGRPRVDVTLKISGLFRDAFPHAVELLDQAVRMVAALTEDTTQNFVRAHVQADVAAYEAEGRDDAWELATARVFGPQPGSFGTGVDYRVETGSWTSGTDLANTFIESTGFAYGGGRGGSSVPEALANSLGRIEATVHNESTAESDILSSDVRFSEHGGLIAAVSKIRGKAPEAFVGDTHATGARQQTLKESLRSTARSRLLNPSWKGAMKTAGYSGAGQLSASVDAMAGWAATSDAVDPGMLERLARSYVTDEETREWLSEVNPHALQHMAGQFLDLAERGLWDVDDDLKAELVEVFMDAEGDVEEATDV